MLSQNKSVLLAMALWRPHDDDSSRLFVLRRQLLNQKGYGILWSFDHQTCHHLLEELEHVVFLHILFELLLVVQLLLLEHFKFLNYR